MESRVKLTIILAIVLMALVMVVAAAITFFDVIPSRQQWSIKETWTQKADTVSSMKMTNLSGTGKSDLFAQAINRVLVCNTAGEKIFDQEFPGTLAAVMGEVDGDGISEVMVYYSNAGRSWVAAFKIDKFDQPLWQSELYGLGTASRAAVVDFSGSGRSGMVIGDENGRVVAISEEGEELWRYDLQSTSLLRGLDNVLAGNEQLVAVADEAGKVVVLDRNGEVGWTFNVSAGLRRLRTEEVLGPGRSVVLLGGEDGSLAMLDGKTGEVLWTDSLGQAITEIRLVELDADPGTRELVIGGKRNGVWAYNQAGNRLFSSMIAGEKNKVMEIAGFDLDGDGRDTLAVGDDAGVVTFFDDTGKVVLSRRMSPPINRITSGIIGEERQWIVADADEVHALTMKVSNSFKYWPLIGGLLGCLFIAGVAFVFASMKPAPTLEISSDQMTVEAQKARRIMIHEMINDLKKMKELGEIPAEAYLARLKGLRSQLADVDANLIKLGVPIKAEIINCPHCGGSLELGTDRCDYCGQTVII